ncbi:hypothetical protein HKX48_004814 [Thoreauomyces humboldtii]|nr:hypothetical protein HKX48_004814 [Thoreauomyces humboldtii]
MLVLNTLVGALALSVAVVVGAPLVAPRPYIDHQLVRVDIHPDAQSGTLSSLHQILEAKLHLDVWDVQASHVDFRLPASSSNSVLATPAISSLVSSGLANVTVLHNNLQQVVDAERKRLHAPVAAAASFFTEYQTYAKILAFFQALAKANPTLVTYIPSIGKTVKGVDIFAIRITSSKAAATPKKQLFIQGLIHAREWITGSTVAYMCQQLVTDFATDPTLLNAVEFVLVPVVNPDGYMYTWTTERLWRKNLGASGNGVDLNRNYDDGHWNEGGSSDDPTDETYHGVSAASEPETQAVQNYFLAQTNLVGAIDFHSYSQVILRPLGYSESNAPDEKLNKQAADGIAATIKATTKEVYTSIKSFDLYITTGDSTDFWYKNRRIYAFAIELRPTDGGSSGDGFVLAPSQIIPTGKEIYASVVSWGNFVVKNTLPTKLVPLPAGPDSS